MASPLAAAVAQARREVELAWAAEEERELELTERERYARDPVGWINDHVWIASKFAGTGKVAAQRMRPFADQIRSIDAWINLQHLTDTGELVWRNTVIEKSRQIGETWLFAAVICWALLFHRDHGLAMHRKGAKIDDGGTRNTIDSLFGKVRYIDRRLDRGKHPYLGRLAFRPFSRDPAKVENLDSGAFIVGEGQTDDPGRGDTFDYVLIDEAAFVEHGEKVYAAIDDACPEGKALLSTVNGEGNFHARLADERPVGWTYLRLHWSTHPFYSEGLHVAGEDPDCPLCAGVRDGLDWSPREPRAHRYPGKLTSPWYDRAVIGKTEEQVANELDIDRERALSGRVFAEFSTDLHLVAGGVPYSVDLELELAFDYGLDVTSVIVLQDHPEELRAIGLLEMGDLFGTTATPDRVAAELRDYLVDLGLEERFSTVEWTRKIYAIGDPAGHDRSQESARPLVEAYRKAGFTIGRPARRYTRTVESSVAAVKRLLLGTPKPIRICGLHAGGLAEHLRNNVWPTDAIGRRRLGATKPLDDIHNHACRALAYYTVAKFPPRGDQVVEGERWDPREAEPDLLERRRDRSLRRGDLDARFPKVGGPL